MWHFAVGLYLVHFDGGVLLLAAIYGFTCGGTVMLLGGLIGQWVDRNPRLKGNSLCLVLIYYLQQRNIGLINASCIY